MKRLIIIIFIAAIALIPARGAEWIELADSAYNAEDYLSAVELYSAAIDSIGPSSDLYYNLGNSYYRTGQPGRAIVAYERALRINPRNSDARANLEFVNTRIVDRPGERGTLAERIFNSTLDMATPNAWAWVAFALFVLTLGAVALYCFSSKIIVRKIGFFGGIALFFITCLSIFIAVKSAARTEERDNVIVISPSTILSTSPSEPRSPEEEVMLLHEGSKLYVIDSIRSGNNGEQLWLDVEADNTHRAWVKASDTERI